MSIVECKVCKEIIPVYFHVMNKKDYTCDSCTKKSKLDAVHAKVEGGEK